MLTCPSSLLWYTRGLESSGSKAHPTTPGCRGTPKNQDCSIPKHPFSIPVIHSPCTRPVSVTNWTKFPNSGASQSLLSWNGSNNSLHRLLYSADTFEYLKVFVSDMRTSSILNAAVNDSKQPTTPSHPVRCPLKNWPIDYGAACLAFQSQDAVSVQWTLFLRLSSNTLAVWATLSLPILKPLLSYTRLNPYAVQFPGCSQVHWPWYTPPVQCCALLFTEPAFLSNKTRYIPPTFFFTTHMATFFKFVFSTLSNSVKIYVKTFIRWAMK